MNQGGNNCWKFIFCLAIFVPCHYSTAQNFLVSDYVSGKIYEFTTNGTQSTYVSGLNNPSGIALDKYGNLFESDQGSGNIYRFTTNGVQNTFASGLTYPTPMAFDSSGNLFVAESSRTIYKFNQSGVETNFYFTSDSFYPAGLAFDISDNLF